MAARVSRRIREQVIRRAQGYCEYCWCPQSFSTADFAVEHILPRIADGTNLLSNLALGCPGCNNRKFTATEAIDPVTREQVRLYHPRTDRGSEHFRWSDDFTEIIGHSPIGRATVARLQLNRPGPPNIRAALRLLNLYPPDKDTIQDAEPTRSDNPPTFPENTTP
jgi:hypothetical protein